MKKKTIIGLSIAILLFIVIILFVLGKKDKKESAKLDATVLAVTSDSLTVQDANNGIYTFEKFEENVPVEIGQNISIQYSGVIDKNTQVQKAVIKEYTTFSENNKALLEDQGIFSDYYKLAYRKLENMSLDEKIGQLFLVQIPAKDQLAVIKNYHIGGYILSKDSFDNKSKSQVIHMIREFQNASNIPLLMAVDEEGGSVIRVSDNPNLVAHPFKSSQDLYTSGGLDAIKEDTINKSKILSELGINLNLAPVVDVSTNSSDYMYKRTIGENTDITSKYAKTVIESSKLGSVSYTLKHFPGYGNNADTHAGPATDNRSYDDILKNDIPPFTSGIDAGAEAVLISHNIVTNIDSQDPASLSASVHNLLRNKLNFTGVVVTDDLAMKALSSIGLDNAVIKAIQSGNDLIIVSDYKTAIQSVKDALNNSTLSENTIDKLAARILAWKYYKGMLWDSQK